LEKCGGDWKPQAVVMSMMGMAVCNKQFPCAPQPHLEIVVLGHAVQIALEQPLDLSARQTGWPWRFFPSDSGFSMFSSMSLRDA
jgi:hypothetical protein